MLRGFNAGLLKTTSVSFGLPEGKNVTSELLREYQCKVLTKRTHSLSRYVLMFIDKSSLLVRLLQVDQRFPVIQLWLDNVLILIARFLT
jgi:hypothetical protein